jgi:Flp pilus assembly protein TadD
MGRYDEALEQMEKAIQFDIDDPVVYDHQGDIYFALNQDELARQSWSKALELKPDDEAIRAKLNVR